MGKKKKQGGEKSGDTTPKQCRTTDNSPRAYDKDTEIFIAMSQELKEEGNKLFQRRDCEGAMLKYEKALKLLPQNHIDVAYLRSNMAACYMQMGITDYPRAVHECNLALEVSPKYSKALLKRARCYEGLNRLELALRDLNTVLTMEPNNLTALELVERVKQTMETSSSRGDRAFDHPLPDYIESPCDSPHLEEIKHKTPKKRNTRSEEDKIVEDKEVVDKKMEDKAEKQVKVDIEKKITTTPSKEKKKKIKAKLERNTEQIKNEDKVEKRKGDRHEEGVFQEKIGNANGDEPNRNVKLVFGDDIRWAQLSADCNVLNLRKIIQERFPTSSAVLVKYKDEEGDMITITTDEELRWAESASTIPQQGSVKLYIVEVSPEHDPFYEKLGGDNQDAIEILNKKGTIHKKQERSICIEEWIIQFAHLFKNYVGFSSDAYLDLHEVGVKLYSDAMEETICSDEAQVLFDMAAEKFQEMVALALFNWGNVQMARARKRIQFTEDSAMLDQLKKGYEWAQQEYEKAGQKYQEALNIKPNFYEGHLALAQQKFEQARLGWYYAVGNNVVLDTWDSAKVVELYNDAEENIEKGMKMWEEFESYQQTAVSSSCNGHAQMQKMGLDRVVKDYGNSEQAMTMRSQVNVLWGTMLYERSVMEFKLGLPLWHECLEVAIEKFELAGASSTDIAVMIKNHCSNDTAVEGVGFRIDEIVQAWNEMDEAKRWYTGVPSLRLEPLLRRRVSKIYHALDHA